MPLGYGLGLIDGMLAANDCSGGGLTTNSGGGGYCFFSNNNNLWMGWLKREIDKTLSWSKKDNNTIYLFIYIKKPCQHSFRDRSINHLISIPQQQQQLTGNKFKSTNWFTNYLD